jgi:hypothetical protein
MAKSLALLGLIALAAVPQAANACVVIHTRAPTYFELRTQAKKTVAEATAILDGEVIEAGTRDKPARVRVVRVLKGEVPEIISVGEFDTCDIRFETVGERWRFVLQRGPDVYSTWVDYENARQIDRLLKSDRRKDWPFFTPLARP